MKASFFLPPAGQDITALGIHFRAVLESKANIGLWTATFMVIANQIGTGVFTSLGFQVVDIKSGFPIELLWVLGGVAALCGALTYGELGTALPRSGGEYHLLSRIVHPVVGFLSGWVSATVGFAAPTALAAIAFSTYLSAVLPAIPVVHAAAGIVVLFTALHCWSILWGSRFNNVLTSLKVILLLILIVAAFRVPAAQDLTFLPRPGDLDLVLTPAFAVSLVYVAYAYTGWNAAIYIVGEMDNPSRDLPRALLTGTAVVLVLYALVNYAFMHTVPFDVLAGQIEVGYLSASRVFGERGGAVMAVTIALILTSTVSVMIFVGPRIVQVMGEDYPLLRKLSFRSASGIPVYAILVQSAITLAYIYTATFQQVLLYAGFTLNLITAVTVSGVFVLRRREPNMERPYRTWGYPWTPILFLLLSAWSLTFMLIDRPQESLAGLLTLSAGLVIYFLDYARSRLFAAAR
jgi:APA family basic amino acid/polyamine antiporter